MGDVRTLWLRRRPRPEVRATGGRVSSDASPLRVGLPTRCRAAPDGLPGAAGSRQQGLPPQRQLPPACPRRSGPAGRARRVRQLRRKAASQGPACHVPGTGAGVLVAGSARVSATISAAMPRTRWKISSAWRNRLRRNSAASGSDSSVAGSVKRSDRQRSSSLVTRQPGNQHRDVGTPLSEGALEIRGPSERCGRAGVFSLKSPVSLSDRATGRATC